MIDILIGTLSCGKTSFANDVKKLASAREHVRIFSKDAFHKTGARFDKSQIQPAQDWCFRSFIEELITIEDEKQKTSSCRLIIDSQNTTISEIAPYYQAGRSFGHDVTMHLWKGTASDVSSWARDSAAKAEYNVVASMNNRVCEMKFPRFWIYKVDNHAGR